jgi:integrase
MRYRWIDMNDELYDALQDQLNTRLPHTDYVFQNRNPKSPRYGQRFTKRRKLLPGLCKRAGIDKPIRFHSLRRFFASLLADNREKLPTIQKLLGHAAVSTTDRYVHRIRDDTMSAVSKISFKKKAHEGSTQNKKG